jgi:hypothetical protein
VRVRTVSAGYFREGAFASARPGELFASYSCLECGHRAKTWAAFRLHRADCAHQLVARPDPGYWAPTADDLDRLAALTEQLRLEALEEAA